MEDIIRFNEAIDQALAESIAFFSAKVDQARNLLLGMLGHDLRSPLQTIQMTASFLAALNAGANVSEAASRLIGSGARMKALLDDLLDFNRTNLGLGINITPTNVDLADLFAEELDRLRAARPGHRIDLEVQGDAHGVWDGRRLQQVLGNLVLNAIKYGTSDTPVHVAIFGGGAEVRFEVRNKSTALSNRPSLKFLSRCGEVMDLRTAVMATEVSDSDFISRVKSPRPMVARLKRVPTPLKPCSRCGSLATLVARTDGAGHVDRQALVGELVDDRQALDLLAVGAGVEHEVVGPDVIGGPWWQGSRPAGAMRRRGRRGAAAVPLGATADRRATRSLPGPRDAGRSESGDSRSAGTARTAPASPQAPARPSPAAAAR